MQVEDRYRHFCPLARALELVGERWGLLIVRDLLRGDQRYTDLHRSCGGITPRQLAARLRQLEEAGIVERQQEQGRREVRYRLTSTGQDLRPTVDSLLLWGVQHADRPPAADEPVRGYHVLDGTRVALNVAGAVTRPVSWTWRFPDEPHTLRFDGTTWHLSPGEDLAADVIVETSPRAWARLVTTPFDARLSLNERVRLRGRPLWMREFETVFGLAPA